MWWWYQLFKVLFLMRWTPNATKKQWTRLWTTKGGYCFFVKYWGPPFDLIRNVKYIATYFWKLEAYPDGHATNSPKIGGFLFCEIFPSFSFPQKWISMTWISSSIASQIFIRMILRRLPVRVEEYQILESFKKTGKFCTVTKFCGTTGSLVKMVYINWRSVNYQDVLEDSSLKESKTS